jgi:hypothetical protein
MPDQAIHDAQREKPRPYSNTRVWLRSGARTCALWDGRRWWTRAGEVEVARWQYVGDSSAVSPFIQRGAEMTLLAD